MDRASNDEFIEIAEEAMESFERHCYFYITIPGNEESASTALATSREELAAILKQNPGARFHSGRSVEEAMRKATENFQDTDDISREYLNPPKLKRNSIPNGLPALESPKPQELLLLGREISSKQNLQVIQRIEKNPRVLMTDTDSPTILHAGCKYNGLHFAAKSNNFKILAHILNSVSSPRFMTRIYPTLAPNQRDSITQRLVKVYLNSPDKMAQETPLHFACKFNNFESVKILLAHPWCDVDVKNHEGKIPFEIIGSRADYDEESDEELAQVQLITSKIKALFEERYILPIWRDEDVIGDPPAVGEVTFIPDLCQEIPPPLISSYFPDFPMSLLGSCKPQLLPGRKRATVNVFMSQPPAWRIKAFAGPVSEKKAAELRQLLVLSKGAILLAPGTPKASFMTLNVTPEGSQTPPSQMTPTPQFFSPIRSPFLSRFEVRNSPVSRNNSGTDLSIRVRDAEKGLERVAGEYCKELDIPWSEYWPFLGAYADLASETGRDLLEKYFRGLEATAAKEAQKLMVNTSWDDLIKRLESIKLNTCTIENPRISTETDGLTCKNPKCRLEAGWCNCENIFPDLDLESESFVAPLLNESLDVVKEPPENCFTEIREFPSDLLISPSSYLSEKPALEFDWMASSAADDLDVEDEFGTAPSSPVKIETEDVFEDCSNKPIYLSGGDQPGKVDYQVFNIFQGLDDDEIDRTKHLATFQWISSMRACGTESQPNGRERGLRCSLGAAGYTPRRLWKPQKTSTPDPNGSLTSDMETTF